MHIRKEHIPWVMAAARAALGPVLIAGAACSWNGFALAGMVVGALVSDIYDGVLARRWRCDTAGVRLFDSMADTVFYLCTAVALWIGQPQLWWSYRGLLIALLGLEAVRFGFDFTKFGRPASYHSYLAKLWGLVMAVAVIGVFALDRANGLVPAALVLGILCDLEGMAMSIVMPVWRKDIKTVRAAWHLRRQILDERCASLPAAGREVRFGKALGSGWRKLAIGGFFLFVFSVAARPCVAVEAGQVGYMSGTLTVPQGTIGDLDTTSPEILVFKFTASSSAPGEVDIPYKKIGSFEYSTEVAHHLGVLPAVAISLVKRRERRHFFTIRFTDSSGVPQAAIFEVAKRDPPGLLAILRARAPQACRLPGLNCGRCSPAMKNCQAQ
jgi:CDP-diacylglycerol--glycerol-3-phosphate 3-phosphatidyltransferase